MEFSEQKDKIVPAFVAAQSHFKTVAKAKFNQFFKSNYADLAAFIDAITPGLTQHELALIQDQGVEYETRENPNYDPNWTPKTDAERKGRQPSPKIIVGKVHIQSWLYHVSGQYLQSEILELITTDAGPQGIGKIIAYGRRYQLTSLLGLASKDNDGNTAEQDQIPDCPLDKTALRRYRADLNKRLQACKTVEEWNIQMNEFEKIFEYPLETLTQIRKYETFQSLASEHNARVTEAEARAAEAENTNPGELEDQFNEMADMVNDEAGFKALETFYLENESLQTEINEKTVNDLGAGLRIEGYEFKENEETKPEEKKNNGGKKS